MTTTQEDVKMTSSLEDLPRVADRLSDDLLLPPETVKVRAQARE